jgi:hypothetical protein
MMSDDSPSDIVLVLLRRIETKLDRTDERLDDVAYWLGRLERQVSGAKRDLASLRLSSASETGQTR